MLPLTLGDVTEQWLKHTHVSLAGLIQPHVNNNYCDKLNEI